MHAKILVVEDDFRLATLLQNELVQSNYAVDVAYNGLDALEKAAKDHYDLVILDLNLPDVDGIEVASRLREDSEISILMLTARGDVESRVEGLYAGASDYMTKPFSVQELRARVHVRLREGHKEDTRLQYGALTLEPEGGFCNVRGESLSLTSLEFRMLELFLENKGRIFSKEDLEDRLYGTDRLPGSNTIEVFVSNLRRKLARVGVDKMIHTVRGMGYVVREDVV